MKEYPEVWQVEYENPSMNKSVQQLTEVPFILELLKKNAPVKIFQMIYKSLLRGKVSYTEKQAQEQKVNDIFLINFWLIFFRFSTANAT